MMQAASDLVIPKRSPNRKSPQKFYDSAESSPATFLDSGSFKNTNDRSSVLDESIFSAIEDENLDFDFDLDLSDIEDILEEFTLDDKGNSTIVYNIDSVVSIVEVHTERLRKTLSVIDC